MNQDGMLAGLIVGRFLGAMLGRIEGELVGTWLGGLEGMLEVTLVGTSPGVGKTLGNQQVCLMGFSKECQRVCPKVNS